jgi:hypothetical protein
MPVELTEDMKEDLVSLATMIASNDSNVILKTESVELVKDENNYDVYVKIEGSNIDILGHYYMVVNTPRYVVVLILYKEWGDEYSVAYLVVEKKRSQYARETSVNVFSWRGLDTESEFVPMAVKALDVNTILVFDSTSRTYRVVDRVKITASGVEA